MKKQRIAWIVIGFVVVVLITLVVPWFFQTTPPVVNEPPWDSPQTRALAQRACFDCHSNETRWPAYSRIPPVSWLVTFDVWRGRRHLNFSEWSGARRREGGGEIGDVVQNGSMPPSIYLSMHPEASLTADEKQQLTQGLRASLR